MREYTHDGVACLKGAIFPDSHAVHIGAESRIEVTDVDLRVVQMCGR